MLTVKEPSISEVFPKSTSMIVIPGAIIEDDNGLNSKISWSPLRFNSTYSYLTKVIPLITPRSIHFCESGKFLTNKSGVRVDNYYEIQSHSNTINTLDSWDHSDLPSQSILGRDLSRDKHLLQYVNHFCCSSRFDL